MFPNLSSIVLGLLFPYLYILFTYLDYNKNKKDYYNFRFSINKTIFDAYPNVFRNIIIVVPLTILVVFNIWEIEITIYSLEREIVLFILHSFFADIYYWTLHYYAHKIPFIYKNIHKKHHEFSRPIGFMAFYADIPEVILFNLGSTLFFHILLCKLSMYHLIFYMILGTYFPIMDAHTSSKIDVHQIHHLKNKYNYGFNIFMDRLMGTYKNNIIR
jgi:methylsterol monooxygenase